MPRSASKWDVMRDANERVSKFRRDDETKWFKWVQVKHVQQTGNNMKYIYLTVKGKRRKKNNILT